MRLYVANTTKQNQIVCYRLDFDRDGNQKDTNRRFEPARQQEIPPGRQVQLGSDFHPNQVHDIVEQLSTYGLIGVVDVPRLRKADLDNLRQGVVPYVFNLDQPVPQDAMRKVIAHNSAILVDDGRDRRAKAAVASSQIVQDAVQSEFANRGIDDKPSDRFSLAVEQDEQSEAGERKIEEGYRVSSTEPQSPAFRGGKKTRRK